MRKQRWKLQLEPRVTDVRKLQPEQLQKITVKVVVDKRILIWPRL